MLFAAAEPVESNRDAEPASAPTARWLTSIPFGRGASYRVVSRTPDATEATLRAADAQRGADRVTDERTVQPPIATDRVRARSPRR